MDILKRSIIEITYLTICLLCIIKNAASLECLQCDSTNERTCAESLPQHHSLFADSCDHIQEASYCVKMTGVFEVESVVECYQCDSSKHYCPEHFKEPYHELPETSVSSLVPKSCDQVFEARYCIKTTGLFEGELGTKRFCSSRDWGNYCEWIRRPGDEREYRACVFTCWGNSCNKGHSNLSPSGILIPLTTGISIILYKGWMLLT